MTKSKIQANSPQVDSLAELTEEEQLIAKLNGETAIVAWKEIERFFAAGTVLLLAQGEDLIHCAAAMTQDNKAHIEPLIDSEKLQAMPMEFVIENCKQDTEFWSVVVAPYILAQLK